MQAWWQKQFPNGCQFMQIEDANQQLVQLAYGEKGQGATIILLHGWGLWSYSWNKNIDYLAQYYRVVCLDFKGCGFSDKPEQPEVVGHQIIETIRFIQKISTEPVILLGESLGGLVALGVAEQAPELVSHLIVIDAAIFTQKIPHLGMYLLGKMPLNVVKNLGKLGLTKLLYPSLFVIAKQSYKQVHYRPIPADIDTRIKHNIYPFHQFPNALVKLIEDTQIGIIELSKYEQGEANKLAEIQQKLPTITCPVLIIWGEKDKWFPLSHAERLQQTLPYAQLHIIPDCGHHAVGDAADTINQVVIEFLKENDKII
jgi:pimeloyl-ACP methyl ester carboxylesterase